MRVLLLEILVNECEKYFRIILEDFIMFDFVMLKYIDVI